MLRTKYSTVSSMMYSALNLRPYMTPLVKESHHSYWFLAIGYFNVVLPSFIPRDLKDGRIQALLWERARSAKRQCDAAIKSPFAVFRTLLLANERKTRAIRRAGEDEKLEALNPWKQSVLSEGTVPEPVLELSNAAPSQALIGLSLLGNLDGIYQHATFVDSGIRLHDLTTGSRQRSGAMLLFAYTFVGKLCLSFGYDENGLEKNSIDRFWGDLVWEINKLSAD